jgi:hypothetical protein
MAVIKMPGLTNQTQNMKVRGISGACQCADIWDIGQTNIQESIWIMSTNYTRRASDTNDHFMRPNETHAINLRQPIRIPP